MLLTIINRSASQTEADVLCGCATPIASTPVEGMRRADLVVRAYQLDRQEIFYDEGRASVFRSDFAVMEAWKGTSAVTVSVVDNRTSCAYGFGPGIEFMIYGDQINEDSPEIPKEWNNWFFASVCSRTRPYSAEEAAGLPQATIFPTLTPSVTPSMTANVSATPTSTLSLTVTPTSFASATDSRFASYLPWILWHREE